MVRRGPLPGTCSLSSRFARCRFFRLYSTYFAAIVVAVAAGFLLGSGLILDVRLVLADHGLPWGRPVPSPVPAERRYP